MGAPLVVTPHGNVVVVGATLVVALPPDATNGATTRVVPTAGDAYDTDRAAAATL